MTTIADDAVRVDEGRDGIDRAVARDRHRQAFFERARAGVASWASLAAFAVCFSTLACAADGASTPAARLAAKYEEVSPKLARNEFQRPVTLDSEETSRSLRGDIYTTVDYAFDVVQSELTDPQHWCDVMILHQNTKYCRVNGSGTSTALAVQVGRKYEEAVEPAKAMRFAYSQQSEPPDYFRVALEADNGMFGTRNYHIVLEGVPLGPKKTFLHLAYSYEFGLAAKLALQTYLNTLGSGKVGFTVVDKGADGKPVYVGDVRGALERNVMRIYLAIDAYLDSLGLPPAQRPEKRIRDWFAATERYAQQLHELDANEYVTLKTREYRRMQVDAASASTGTAARTK